jgi:periplasmic protein TonB
MNTAPRGRQSTAIVGVIGIHAGIAAALLFGMTIHLPPAAPVPTLAKLIRPARSPVEPIDPPTQELTDTYRPRRPESRRIDVIDPPGPRAPVLPADGGAGETSRLPVHADPPVIFASVRDLRALAELASSCYPAPSRRMGEEGLVVLSVYVAANGTITDAKLERSSGIERLDEAAIRCVQSSALRGAWIPQTIAGQKVGARMRLPWRWKLN